MTAFLHYPYPDEPKTQFWGPPESNSNFCEEDYILSPYIGEFVNTLTNVTYVIYGVYGLRRTSSRPDGGLFSTLSFPYWALISVGVLSAWFHATLKYHSQMGDDLSMLLASGAVFHQLYTFQAPPAQRRKTLFLILATLIPISTYHILANELLIHQLTFAALIILVARRSRALIHTRIQAPSDRKALRRLATLGTAASLFGYALWNVDVHACGVLTRAKRGVGLPWGMLLELHGWWHFFTGVGAYAFMVLVEVLVEGVEGGEGFVWPARGVLDALGRGGEGEKDR